MQRDRLPTPWDPETHFTVVKSNTPVSEDGYKPGEPMYLECDECGARELLTPEPTPGADQFNHGLVDGERCPQWMVRSIHWQERHPDATEKILESLSEDDLGIKQPVVADGGREE